MRRSAEKQQEEEEAGKKARDEEIFLQDRDNRGSIFDNMEEKEQREQDAGQMAEFLGRAKNH